MTKRQLATHARLYRDLDKLASHAQILGDETNMDRYLDARNAIGRVIYLAHWATWKALHDARGCRQTTAAYA